MPIHFTCPHCGTSTEVDDRYAGQTGPCAACGATITIPSSMLQGSGAAVVVPARDKSSNIAVIVVVLVMVVFALIFCVGILAALLFPAVQAGREAGRKTVCLNNERNIQMAMEMYALQNGHYPPAYEMRNGHPVSWRVLILPYLERNDLYEQYDFNEPWDGPNNSNLHNITMEVFACPSDPPTSTTSNYTAYVVVNAEGGIFNGTQVTALEDISSGDGRSMTLLLVEMVGSDIHWMEPRDLNLATMAEEVNGSYAGDAISSYHPGGANVVFADGQARFLGEEIDPDTLKALITYNGGEMIDEFDIP